MFAPERAVARRSPHSVWLSAFFQCDFPTYTRKNGERMLWETLTELFRIKESITVNSSEAMPLCSFTRNVMCKMCLVLLRVQARASWSFFTLGLCVCVRACVRACVCVLKGGRHTHHLSCVCNFLLTEGKADKFMFMLFCLVFMFLLKHFHPIISVSSSANLSRQSPEFTEQKILGDIVEGSGYYAIPLSSGVFSRVLLITLTPLFNLTWCREGTPPSKCIGMMHDKLAQKRDLEIFWRDIIIVKQKAKLLVGMCV